MARERLPDWFKIRPPSGAKVQEIRQLVSSLELATVCQEARCPNLYECWGGGTATFMVMGDTCTRGCRFCHVKTGNPAGLLDAMEPQKVARSVKQLGSTYVVITSVDRDDLPDGGAAHFAAVIDAVHQENPDTLVEVLTPDFAGAAGDMAKIVAARPAVIAHNIETVRRLSPTVRDRRADYDQTLAVLRSVKDMDPTRFTKSSIMLGLGETDEEVRQTMVDLKAAGVDVLTLGQYLRPSKEVRFLEVEEYVHPDKFAEWKRIGEQEIGFLYVASGPLVRSSYRAGEFFLEGLLRRGIDPGDAPGGALRVPGGPSSAGSAASSAGSAASSAGSAASHSSSTSSFPPLPVLQGGTDQ